eukprot:5216325-Pyramimonas_sp.AAC.1
MTVFSICFWLWQQHTVCGNETEIVVARPAISNGSPTSLDLIGWTPGRQKSLLSKLLRIEGQHASSARVRPVCVLAPLLLAKFSRGRRGPLPDDILAHSGR